MCMHMHMHMFMHMHTHMCICTCACACIVHVHVHVHACSMHEMSDGNARTLCFLSSLAVIAKLFVLAAAATK